MAIEADFRLFICVARLEINFQRERLVVVLATADSQLPAIDIAESGFGLIGLRTTCAAMASYQSIASCTTGRGARREQWSYEPGPTAMIPAVFQNVRAFLGGTTAEIERQLHAASLDEERLFH